MKQPENQGIFGDCFGDPSGSSWIFSEYFSSQSILWPFSDFALLCLRTVKFIKNLLKKNCFNNFFFNSEWFTDEWNISAICIREFKSINQILFELWIGQFWKMWNRENMFKDLHSENCWKKVSSWYLMDSNRYSAIPGAIV